MNSVQLQYTCPSCSARFDAPSRYCRKCGSSMDEDEAASDDTMHSHEELRSADLVRQADEPRRRRSDSERDQWLGRVIDNRYRVIEVIGRGGMGMVYKIEHIRMGKIAAMKVLHNEYDDDLEVVERFHREAEAVSRLAHPNTVQVFDFGSSRGTMYLIMEFIRGQNMSALLHRDGPLPFSRSGPMFVQICAALAEAHSMGVIHRDLKPENVIVTRTQRGRDFVKVLDFGLAKLTEREEPADVTDKGLIVGTPYYMSPEQIRGENVDQRTDVYSLGSLMYRMLTGHHAFTAKTPVGVLTKHLTTELTKPSERAPKLDIHPLLDQLIETAMAKNRDERYGTILEMLEAIESAYIEVCGQSTPVGFTGLSAVQQRSSSPSKVVRNLTIDDSDEIFYGILSSVRLQRSDLDEFERSLTRRRWFGLALVPLIIAAIAAIAVYLIVFRDTGPSTQERERNDDLEHATLIAPGTSVTGYIGKRIDKSTADRDFYELENEHATSVVTAHVTKLPNIDIELSLLDNTGKVLAHVDENRMGHEEWLRRYRVRGSFYVRVTEASKGRLTGLPTENISDAYTLSVALEGVSNDREIEPNESSSDAHVLRVDEPVEGYLDRRADIDSYRFEGAAGRYQLSIDGASQVPLTWQTGDSEPSAERKALIELAPGYLIRLSRNDTKPAAEGEPALVLTGQSSPYTLLVRRSPEP